MSLVITTEAWPSTSETTQRDWISWLVDPAFAHPRSVAGTYSAMSLGCGHCDFGRSRRGNLFSAEPVNSFSDVADQVRERDPTQAARIGLAQL